MATMSIGKAWEEAVTFVARERSLLFPVALLFIALPGLIVQEITPPELANWTMAKPMPSIRPGFALAMILGAIVIWFGSLTLFALALRPGISVKEALSLSLKRLPTLLGAALIVAGMLLAAILVAAIVVVGLTLVAKAAGAAMGMLLAILASGMMLFVSVRLLLLNPVVIDGAEGAMASLRHGWALTRGQFWRLFAFLIVLTLLSAIVGAAAQAVFGVIGALVAGPTGGRLTGGIATAAISTVVQVYMLVMIARLYRQAEGG